MKTNKKLIIAVMLAALVGASAIGVAHAVSPKEQARIVAEENLQQQLKVVEPEYDKFYFQNKDEVRRATLGDPIEIQSIDPVNYDENKPLEEQMKPSPVYVFPIIVDGRVTTDITIALMNGEWQVNDIGGNMNQRIEKITKKSNLSSPRVMAFEGNIYVFADKNNQRVGFLPNAVPLDQIDSSKVDTQSNIQNNIGKRHREIMQTIKDRKGSEIVGSNFSLGWPTEFRQPSVTHSLYKYMKHVL